MRYGHWDPDGNDHLGWEDDCGYPQCDPLRKNRIQLIREIVEDSLHDMIVDWDGDMVEKYGDYNNAQYQIRKIMKENLK